MKVSGLHDKGETRFRVPKLEIPFDSSIGYAILSHELSSFLCSSYLRGLLQSLRNRIESVSFFLTHLWNFLR